MKKALKNFAVAAVLVLGMAACNNMTSSKSSDSAGGSSGGGSNPVAGSGGDGEPFYFSAIGSSSFTQADDGFAGNGDIPLAAVTAFKPSTTPPADGVAKYRFADRYRADIDITDYIIGWVDGNTMYYFASGYSDSGRKIPVSILRTFDSYPNLTEIDLTGFDTSRVTDMTNMFGGCSKLTTIRGLDSLDTSRVTNMSFMFRGCSSLTSLDLSSWDTSRVTNIFKMFWGCTGLTSVNLSGWNMSSLRDSGSINCPDVSNIFLECSSLTSANMSGWVVSDVVGKYFNNSIYGYDGPGLTIDVSGWDTSRVTTMRGMFSGLSRLTAISGLDTWDTSRVTDMRCMFMDCTGLTSLNLSGWNTSHVTHMSDMFSHCTSLTTLDLSGWDTSRVTTMSGMFEVCSSLTTIYASPSFVAQARSNGTYDAMFADCTSLSGGAGTSYTTLQAAAYGNTGTVHPSDGSLARIDGGTANPGYFTAK